MPDANITTELSRLRDALRTWPLLLVGLIAMGIVLMFNQAKFGLLLWGVARIALCAWFGYWIDRALFYYARPHNFSNEMARTVACCRRALIVAAVLLAGALLP